MDTIIDISSVVMSIFLSAMILANVFRIILSWYPQIDLKQMPYLLIYAPTEPLLAIFRKLVPPLGGVDMAPVIAVALFSFCREILLGQQGILTMLDRLN
jgi:YggT family protein